MYISRRLAGGVAGDVAMVVELLGRYPREEDRGWIFREAAWRLDLSLAFEHGASLGRSASRGASLPLLPLEGDLDAAMRERVRLPFDADWQTDPRSVVIRVQLPRACCMWRRRASGCSAARCTCSSSGWWGPRCCCSSSPRCS